MPIDPKAALTYLGFDPDAEDMDLDKFKAHVSTTYVPRAEAHKDEGIAKMVLGKTMGSLRTKLNSVATDLGVEGEWKEIDPVQGIEVLGAAAKGKLATFAQELEEAKKGGNTSQEAKAIQKQYEDLKAQFDQRGGIIEKLQTEYTGFKETVAKEKQTWKIEEGWKHLRSSIKPNEGVDALKMKGFEALLRERVKLELNEEGQYVAIDQSTGTPFLDPDKLHRTLPPDEVVKRLATEQGIIGGNPNAGRPVRTTVSILGGQLQQQTQQPQGPLPARRRVMPTA